VKEILRSRIGVTCANRGDDLSGVPCESEFGPFEAFTLRFRLPRIFPGLGSKDGKSRVEPKLLTDRWPLVIKSAIRCLGIKSQSRSSARPDDTLWPFILLSAMPSSTTFIKSGYTWSFTVMLVWGICERFFPMDIQYIDFSNRELLDIE